MTAPAPPARRADPRTIGWVLLGVGLAAWMLLAAKHPGHGLDSMVVAWSALTASALGALFADQVLVCCGARWQLPLRSALEALHGLLPIALGGLALALLCPLSQREHQALLRQDPTLAALTLALAAAAVTVSQWLRHCSAHLEAAGPAGPWARRRALLSQAALLPLALGTCLLAMAAYHHLDPFSSSILGILLASEGLLMAVALWTLLIAIAMARRRLQLGSAPLVALGRLLLALVMVTAYVAYAQLIITWMGDLPDGAAWYAPRMHGYLGALAVVAGLLGYGLPFAALLSQGLKRRALLLTPVAVALLLGHYAMWWWTLMPALQGDGVRLQGCDLSALMVVCGATTVLVAHSRRYLTMPRGDPELDSGLAYSERIG